MALFELKENGLIPVKETTFNTEGIKERIGLQKILREYLHLIVPEILVIAEEFGDFEGSQRRIDLLAIDKDANLIVVEIKRTEDGGHMELQAIRYAAMISAMTFDQIVDANTKFLHSIDKEEDAREAILSFLGWDEPDEEQFAQDVRILLISANFSKEITSAVMWLNERDIDIVCIRLKPYKLDERLLIDSQQIIPLPEMAEYQVQIREKKQKEKASRQQNRDLTKYDVTINGITKKKLHKRQAIFNIIKYLCDQDISPEAVAEAGKFTMSRFIHAEGKVESEELISLINERSLEDGREINSDRFYTSSDELIHTPDHTYALKKQWGSDTVQFMENLLRAFPDKKISYKESDF